MYPSSNPTPKPCMWIRVFSSYLTLWVFPVWVFLPRLKLKFILLYKNKLVWCFHWDALPSTIQIQIQDTGLWCQSNQFKCIKLRWEHWSLVYWDILEINGLYWLCVIYHHFWCKTMDKCTRVRTAHDSQPTAAFHGCTFHHRWRPMRGVYWGHSIELYKSSEIKLCDWGQILCWLSTYFGIPVYATTCITAVVPKPENMAARAIHVCQKFSPSSSICERRKQV